VSHYLNRFGRSGLLLGREKLRPCRLKCDQRPGESILGRLMPLCGPKMFRIFVLALRPRRPSRVNPLDARAGFFNEMIPRVGPLRILVLEGRKS
jgi:hypothetical protein